MTWNENVQDQVNRVDWQHLLEDSDELETTQYRWIAIKETHTSYSTGVNDSGKAIARMAYAKIRQSLALSESLTPVE
jgi:hypothetical protein